MTRHGHALTPAEHQAGWRGRFLALYRADPAFCKAIDQLYDDHRELLVEDVSIGRRRREGTAPAYVAAVDALCVRFGLDRLSRTDGRRYEGARQVDQTYRLVADLAARGEVRVPSRLFAAAQVAVGFEPDLELSDRFGIMITGWDPRGPETSVKARRRMEREALELIRIEVERRARLVEERAGAVFTDTISDPERDLRWLYEHVARGRTFVAIAKADGDLDDPAGFYADRVRKAVQAMARRVGVDLT